MLLLLILASSSSFAADPAPRPTLKDFMGLNTHTVQFKPDLYAPVCRRLRDYHPIHWDVAGDPTKPTVFPFAANRVDWSNVYGSWTKAGFDVDACLMFDDIKPDAWKDGNAQSYGQAFAKSFGPSSATPLVTSVEIGNEPAKYSESQYRVLFEGMAKGLRAGDPKLLISTAAVMTGKPDIYSKPVASIEGFENLYDVVNIHSYAFVEGWPTWRRSWPEDPSIKHLKEIESLIQWRNAKAPGKQIWLTEFGYDSTTKKNSPTGDFKKWVGVTDQQQAQYIVRSFLIFSAMDIDRAYLYFFNDKDEPQLHGSSGITRDFKPKPSFHAMAHLYKTLGDYRFSRAVVKDKDLYCYEYTHATKPNEKVYVAWSPTGESKSITKTLALPAIARAERMPTSADPAAPVPFKPTAAGLEIEITESPVYLFPKP